MLGIHELTTVGREAVTTPPLCPNCGRPMHISRTITGKGEQPALRTYGCGECGVWITEAASNLA